MDRTVEQALWYPSSMLDEMQDVARQRGEPLGWCVRAAWSLAKPEVAKLSGNSSWRAEKIFDKHYADSDKIKQVMTLPVPMLDEIKYEAARLDRSMSWLVARSWCVAREQVVGARARS